MKILFIVFVLLWIPCSDGQTIDGCPMYGCRPSGTFSFALNVPKVNASIGWVSDFFLGPIPDFGGCVGNPSNIICQSNGPGPGDTGYKSLDAGSGGVRWKDFVLRFPTLPVLDVNGGIWGSDGGDLMRYDVDGKPEISIQLDPNMRPLFGAQYLDSGVVVLISEAGEIATWLSDGTPLAREYIKGTVERSNGTFLPIAPAVVNSNRLYVLTEFKPDDIQNEEGNLGLQRLYAIDVRESMTDRLPVAWYANFEREHITTKRNTSRLRFRPTNLTHRLISKLRDPTEKKPSLLWDKVVNTVYVSLPPPMLAPTSSVSSILGSDMLWGIKDVGNDSELVFKTVHSASNMAMYEINTNTHTPPSNAGDQLWVSLTDGKLLAIEKLGSISKVLDLSTVIKANFTITSKLTTARAKEADEDFLLFGINVPTPTDDFRQVATRFGVDTSIATPKNYVIGIDTPENKNTHPERLLESPSADWPISFMIATPGDTQVFGQIIGVKNIDNDIKDQLLVFAQTVESAKIFTIV